MINFLSYAAVRELLGRPKEGYGFRDGFGIKSAGSYLRLALLSAGGKEGKDKSVANYLQGKAKVYNDDGRSFVEKKIKVFDERYINKLIVFNPLITFFKLADFLINLAFQAAFFVVSLALGLPLFILGLPLEALKGSLGENSLGYRIPALVLNVLALPIRAAHFVIFTAMNLLAFTLNCILSPVSTLVLPMRDLWAAPSDGEVEENLLKRDLTKNNRVGFFLTVGIGALLVAAIVVALAFSGGALLPAVLSFMAPVIAPVSAFLSPVLAAMSGVFGGTLAAMLACKIALGTVLSLVAVNIVRSIVTLEAVHAIKARAVDMLTFASGYAISLGAVLQWIVNGVKQLFQDDEELIQESDALSPKAKAAVDFLENSATHNLSRLLLGTPANSAVGKDVLPIVKIGGGYEPIQNEENEENKEPNSSFAQVVNTLIEAGAEMVGVKDLLPHEGDDSLLDTHSHQH